MMEQLIIAGFGGQGVLTAGRLLAYAGMLEGKEVSWLPSYGPEMRGGTANCNVIITDGSVGSPVITQGDVIAMNRPSLDKFEQNVAPGGRLFINSAIIDKKAERSDIEVYYVPANEIAAGIGNEKVANMVMVGAYLAKCPVVTMESVIESLRKSLGPGKEGLIPVNEQALSKGADSVK